MAAYYPFEIHTPYRRFYADSVESIVVRLMDGDIGVYANHAFLISPVKAGIIKIKDSAGGVKRAFTAEGVLEVKAHKTVLLVDAAEWPEEIDEERAIEAKKRAEAVIQANGLKFEVDKAKRSLARADARLAARKLATS
jgi:F-type H+-transporting ATPase subunit epsilon